MKDLEKFNTELLIKVAIFMAENGSTYLSYAELRVILDELEESKSLEVEE